VLKRIGIIVLVAVGLTAAGCGGGSGPGSGNINGTWSATLSNMDGSTAYSFTSTFTQGSGSSVSFTNFTFSSAGPCFASEETTETGSFGLAGNFNGAVSGTFAMTISTMFPSAMNNVLTLQGTVNGNTISGTWILAGGTGCNGNGTFVIHTQPRG